MDLRNSDPTESRFAAYVEGLVGVIGHADRNGPLRDYCVGLMLPCERKSVEPMAARTAQRGRRRNTRSCYTLSGWFQYCFLSVKREPRAVDFPALKKRNLAFEKTMHHAFGQVQSRGEVLFDKLVMDDFQPQLFGKLQSHLSAA